MSKTERDTLTPTERVELQIRFCNRYRDEGNVERANKSIMTLLGNIRPDLQEKVANRKSEYISMVEEWEYKERNKRKLGTPENPVYRNLPTDDNYDPYLRQIKKHIEIKKDPETGEEYEAEIEEETFGEPVLISPRLVKKENVDFYKLFVIIQEELYEAGQTWKKPNIGET